MGEVWKGGDDMANSPGGGHKVNLLKAGEVTNFMSFFVLQGPPYVPSSAKDLKSGRSWGISGVGACSPRSFFLKTASHWWQGGNLR